MEQPHHFRRATGPNDAGFLSDGVASGLLTPRSCSGREERKCAGKGDHKEKAAKYAPVSASWKNSTGSRGQCCFSQSSHDLVKGPHSYWCILDSAKALEIGLIFHRIIYGRLVPTSLSDLGPWQVHTKGSVTSDRETEAQSIWAWASPVACA